MKKGLVESLFSYLLISITILVIFFSLSLFISFEKGKVLKEYAFEKEKEESAMLLYSFLNSKNISGYYNGFSIIVSYISNKNNNLSLLAKKLIISEEVEKDLSYFIYLPLPNGSILVLGVKD